MVTEQKFVLIKDRIEFYLDFAINLVCYINKYYLDRNSLRTDLDIRHHFSFCYNKVCEDFKREGVDFSENKELKDYFYKHYYDTLYTSNQYSDKEGFPLDNYIKLWKNIFCVNAMKNKAAVGILVELYMIFDKSIEK